MTGKRFVVFRLEVRPMQERFVSGTTVVVHCPIDTALSGFSRIPRLIYPGGPA